MLPGKEGSKGRDSKLGEMLELQPKVAFFLQGSPDTLDDEDGKVLPEPAVLNFAEWVSWKAARCDTPSWWMELSTVLGENNTRRLAREVRASFQLPWQMHELESKEAPFKPPQHHHAFTGEDSCLQSFLFLSARISGNSPPGEDHSICPGPAALGQTEQSASQRGATSFGRECPRIEKGGGLFSVFH